MDGRQTRFFGGFCSKVFLKNLKQELLVNPYPDVQLLGEFPHCLPFCWDPGSVWGGKEVTPGNPRPPLSPPFPCTFQHLCMQNLCFSQQLSAHVRYASYLGHRGKGDGNCLLLMMLYLFILGCFMSQGKAAVGLIWAGLAPSSYIEGKSPHTLSRRDPPPMPSILSHCTG